MKRNKGKSPAKVAKHHLKHAQVDNKVVDKAARAESKVARETRMMTITVENPVVPIQEVPVEETVAEAHQAEVHQVVVHQVATRAEENPVAANHKGKRDASSPRLARFRFGALALTSDDRTEPSIAASADNGFDPRICHAA